MSIPSSSLPSEESNTIEFKDSFDPRCWSELIKDIVAIANSGGGQIYVGLFEDGRPSGADVSDLLSTDLADIVNKIHALTDVNFSNLQVLPVVAGAITLVRIEIGPTTALLVFGKAGNYTDASGKSKCAFQPGTVYVRHGPKSEPATTDDLRSIIEARVVKDRQSLLANLRQVVEAPANAIVTVGVPIPITLEQAVAGPYSVRLVEANDA